MKWLEVVLVLAIVAVLGRIMREAYMRYRYRKAIKAQQQGYAKYMRALHDARKWGV